MECKKTPVCTNNKHPTKYCMFTIVVDEVVATYFSNVDWHFGKLIKEIQVLAIDSIIPIMAINGMLSA